LSVSETHQGGVGFWWVSLTLDPPYRKYEDQGGNMRMPLLCAANGGLRPPVATSGAVSRARRNGFTLLEVLLAMSIGVTLLGALYVAVDLQVRQAQFGRELVEEANFARSLLTRMNDPIASAINLPNPARFRSPSTKGGSASSAASGMTSTTGGTSTSTPTTTQAGVTDAITIPYGIQGDSGLLSLYISKVLKNEILTTNGDVPPPVSDTRRITYWLAPGGLAMQEVKIITSQDVTNLMPPNLSEDAYQVLAAEVRSLTFSYFDGTTWQDSWDSTTPGADGVTPIGPPRAVAIVVGLAKIGTSGDGDLTLHRHVVSVAAANGTTISSNGTVTDSGVVGGTTTNAYSGGGNSP
jgi:prepilin-type N-terminal cleavage/methylation domain-containing protein